MALAASSHIPSNLMEIVARQLQTQLTQIFDRLKHTPKGKPYNEWKHIPPRYPGDTKTWNGRQFKWCTKCNNGAGQWASAHTTETHVDNFKRTDRKKSPRSQTFSHGILKHGKARGTSIHEGANANANVSFVDQH
jgi:hypothetical protein